MLDNGVKNARPLNNDALEFVWEEWSLWTLHPYHCFKSLVRPKQYLHFKIHWNWTRHKPGFLIKFIINE